MIVYIVEEQDFDWGFVEIFLKKESAEAFMKERQKTSRDPIRVIDWEVVE